MQMHLLSSARVFYRVDEKKTKSFVVGCENMQKKTFSFEVNSMREMFAYERQLKAASGMLIDAKVSCATRF